MERKLTGAQKSAAILIALGVENASSVYKYLKEEDVEQITYEIAHKCRIWKRTNSKTY
jgi:flagellar motor switch protein FliG